MVFASAAHAGGRGGSSQVFDPNNYPGANIYCLTATVAGKCPTGAFNATCNGVADDSPNLQSFQAAALAGNPTRAVLYIPPGSTCHFAGVNAFNLDTAIGGSGGFQYGPSINNLVVWAYGATADLWGVAGEGFGQDDQTVSRIATVSAGSLTVTALGGGESKFAVGDWIAVTGINLQNSGYPQNFQFYEYHVIANISGTTIILDNTLRFSYKSTWPNYSAFVGTSVNYGGPATIYKMGPSWNSQVAVYGLTWAPTGMGQEVPLNGKEIIIYDVPFQQKYLSSSGNGPAPTIARKVWFFNSQLSTLSTPPLTGGVSSVMETDKVIEFMQLYNVTGFILGQSAAPIDYIFERVYGTISGTGQNTTIRNVVLPAPVQSVALSLGTNCYGHNSAITIEYVTIANGGNGQCNQAASLFSWDSAGTLTVSDSDAQMLGGISAWGVPGKKYFFGHKFGSDICNGGVTFTITDITQSGGNTHYVTDIPNGALPTPTCTAAGNLGTADLFVPYGAETITQRYSTGTDMTQFAPP
jgi:hypothetical protein